MMKTMNWWNHGAMGVLCGWLDDPNFLTMIRWPAGQLVNVGGSSQMELWWTMISSKRPCVVWRLAKTNQGYTVFSLLWFTSLFQATVDLWNAWKHMKTHENTWKCGIKPIIINNNPEYQAVLLHGAIDGAIATSRLLSWTSLTSQATVERKRSPQVSGLSGYLYHPDPEKAGRLGS